MRKDVVFDIDGTLADVKHRRHFVQKPKKDWSSFFAAMVDDMPRKDIVKQLKIFARKYNIILVTGRSENYRELTEHWLEKNDIRYQKLLMRPMNNSRPDTEIKQNILNVLLDKNNIHCVVDDRPSVIRMWRSNGLNVIDVGDGIEF